MPIIIPVTPGSSEAFDSVTVANAAGRLALTDDLGQVALQTDTGELWRQVASPASVAASWLQISIDAPSADAGNEIVTGTDGKHFYAAENRVHLTNTAVAPATAGEPTLAEITAAIGTSRDAVLYYTGDDLPASAPTHVYHVDPAGAVTLLLAPASTATANDRVHLTNTLVAPATAGEPTLAEITTAAGANRDTVLYYTGDDLPASVPTYVYHIDQAGAVTLLLNPAGANIYTSDGAIPAGVNRIVTMGDDTGSLTIDNGSNPIVFNGLGKSGVIDTNTFESDGRILQHATGVDVTPDMRQFHTFRIRATNASTGNVVVAAPTNVPPPGNRLYVSLVNDDTGNRTFAMNAAFLGFNASAMGSLILAAGERRSLCFERKDIGTDWNLYSDSNGFSTGGATIFTRVNNVADRDALTGMNAGDIVPTLYPPVTWRYDGTSWQEWDSSESLKAPLLSIDTSIADGFMNPFANGRLHGIFVSAAGADLNVGFPSAAFNAEEELEIHLTNSGNNARNIVFHPVFKDETGADIGTITLSTDGTSNTSLDTLFFRRRKLDVPGSDEYWLTGGTRYPVNGATSERTLEIVSQTGHGFTTNQAVYHNGTNWSLSQADAAPGVAQGVVTRVINANSFEVTTHGVVTIAGHGLTVGEYYWLSQTTAGAITATQPTSGIGQQLLHVRDANTLFIDVEQAISVTSNTPSALSYLSLSNSANQALSLNPAPNFATWDQTKFTSGSLTQNANGSVTLKAGKTYRLTANLRHPGVVGSAGDFAFWDNTGLAEIGERIALYPVNAASQDNGLTTQVALFSPTVDSDVGVRFVTGAMSDISPSSTFVIEEVPTQTTIPAGSGPLHFISVNGSNPTTYAPRTGSFMDMDSPATNLIVDPFGLLNLNAAGDSVKVKQDGRYLISVSAECLSPTTLQTNINTSNNIAAVSSSGPGNHSSSTAIVELVAGDDIYIVSTDTLRSISLTVTQLPKNG